MNPSEYCNSEQLNPSEYCCSEQLNLSEYCYSEQLNPSEYCYSEQLNSSEDCYFEQLNPSEYCYSEHLQSSHYHMRSEVLIVVKIWPWYEISCCIYNTSAAAHQWTLVHIHTCRNLFKQAVKRGFLHSSVQVGLSYKKTDQVLTTNNMLPAKYYDIITWKSCLHKHLQPVKSKLSFNGFNRRQSETTWIITK
jgi:hypothetical protein